MQYANHIFNGIYPTIISIGLFWAFHMLHQDIRIRYINSVKLLLVLSIDISPQLSYKLTILSSQLKFEKHIQCNPLSLGWVLII